MWTFQRSPGSSGYSHGVEARLQERFAAGHVRCPLGNVVDLSASGLRAQCERRPPLKPRQVLTLRLRTGQHQLELIGRVVRISRLTWRRYDIGIEFVDVTERLATVLKSLAQFGFLPRGKSSADTAGSGPGTSGPGTNGPGIQADFGVPNHYEALGLSREATVQDIRRAYRSLARQLHPDMNPAREARERFLQVKEAYETLSNAPARQEYDGLISKFQGA